MSLLHHFNLVYGTDARILDPSVEPNAVTGIGPQLHLEPFHLMRWLVGEFPCSKSVIADDQAFVFRGHKTEAMIPHIPIPLWPVGPALLKTIIVDSKCQIQFHNPQVQVEGKSVGVALMLLAPPLHCASLPLPAQAGRAFKGLSKVRDAMGRLHRINRRVAQINAFNKKLSAGFEVARKLQVAGAAFQGVLQSLATIRGETQNSTESYRPVQEMLRSSADYDKAQRKLDACPDPLEVSDIDNQAKIESLERQLRVLELQERDLKEQQHEAMLTSTALSQEIRALNTDLDREEKNARLLEVKLAEQRRRLRLAQAQGAATPLSVRYDREVLKQRAALVRCRERLEKKRARVQRQESKRRIWLNTFKNLDRKLDRQARAQMQTKQERRSRQVKQRNRLAKAQASALTQQVNIMMPSLTSFFASFMMHSVKVGMSWDSYWRMSLKVLALMLVDVLEHALGLFGDALLNAGPSAPVSVWVAELAGGLFQGVVGSPLRSWALNDSLVFKVPVQTGSLVGGGFAKLRSEFYWKLQEGDDSPHWVEASGVRSGWDVPGQSLDGIHYGSIKAPPPTKPALAPAIAMGIPEVW